MYLQQCPLEVMQDIYGEFNINEESLRNDVKYLVDWIKKQPHLPNIKDEEWLKKFIIAKKNSLEKAKSKLDAYYRARALVPDILSNRDPRSEEMKRIMKAMTYVVLPKLTPKGERILVWKIFDDKQAELLSADQFSKMIFFHTDLLLKADDCGKIVQIFDLKNISLSFAATLTAAVRKIALITKGAGVVRPREVIVLNVNSILEPLLNAVKSLLPQKIQKRVTFRGEKNTNLTDLLPRNILPSNYGGTEKSVEEYLEDYLTYTEEFSNWFISEDAVKADLTKIPNQNYETHYQLFGLEGSFRKLNLD